MAYSIGTIEKYDRYTNLCMDGLLASEGIQRDSHLDYSCGIFDDGELIATGSFFGNTLRCLAVNREHQGEGLLAQIVSCLTQEELERGNSHLFVYTKSKNIKHFKELGFYPVAETPTGVCFLENHREGFRTYCANLEREPGMRQAAIVMNANPFTLGHRYLVEQAAAENDVVHLFLLSEDKSVFPAVVRKELARRATEDIKNVILHDSGNYIISEATFPGYFFSERAEVVCEHARIDAAVFARIALEIGIQIRYVGQETPDSTTGLYNTVLQSELPEAGISCRVIPRLLKNGVPVSASAVRRLLREGRLEETAPLLPQCTWDYLHSEEAKLTLENIQRSVDGGNG